MEEFCSGVNECDSKMKEWGRGVKEYSRRVDEFVLLGHRTVHLNNDTNKSLFTIDVDVIGSYAHEQNEPDR